MTLAAHDLTLTGRLGAVSVELRPGEITAICGPNGAGKSSLLACLAGLVEADQGAVMLGGAALGTLPAQARAQAIGYLPQSPEVAWDLAVETLVALGRLPWRSGMAEDRAAVAAALATMELEPLRSRPLSRLSGGERGRALIARVLAGTPRWLLADEPLANLDLGHQLALLRTLRELARGEGPGEGPGVVLVMHDLAQAMNHADRAIVLAGGEVIADGPPAAALDPAIIARGWGVTARWLGDPGAQALSIAAI